jgi:hypothetical protein
MEMISKRARVLVVAAAAVLTTFDTPLAQAHGRGGRGGPAVVVRGYYGYPAFGYGYGFGFGPYWGPWAGPYAYGYGWPMGIDLNAASIAGFGALDLNVKPGEAEVWVDGKFVDEAKELDGGPRYLWLKDGAHRVVIYRGGYAIFEEQVEVRAGTARELKVRLEKGAAEPPGTRPVS